MLQTNANVFKDIERMEVHIKSTQSCPSQTSVTESIQTTCVHSMRFSTHAVMVVYG